MSLTPPGVGLLCVRVPPWAKPHGATGSQRDKLADQSPRRAPFLARRRVLVLDLVVQSSLEYYAARTMP